MATKPKFDPSKPFEAAEAVKPKFDPSKPFDAAPITGGEEPVRTDAEIDDANAALLDQARSEERERNKKGPVRTVLERGAKRTGVALDTAANVASGIPAGLGGGLTYLGTLAATGGDTDAAAAVKEGTQNALTYEPRTEGGQAASERIGEVMQVPGKIGTLAADPVHQKLLDLGVNPEAASAIAAAIGTAPDAALQLLGMEGLVKGGKATGQAMRPAETPPVKTKISETPIESTRAAGLAVSPSDVKGVNPKAKNYVQRGLEGAAGKGALAKEISLKNQPKMTRGTIDDLGMPPETKALTPSVFGKARQPHVKTYRQAEQAVGDFAPSPEYAAALDSIVADNIPRSKQATFRKDIEAYKNVKSGADATAKIRKLRDEAKIASKSPLLGEQIRGKAYKKMANALEDEFGLQLESRGQPDLLNKWRDARQALARIRNAEDATVAGQISAVELKKLRDAGEPLSGYLAALADAAEHTPAAVEHSVTAAKGAESPPSFLGKTAEAIGLRPALRKVLASDAYQNTFIGKAAPKIGPGAGLSDYYPQGKPPAPKAPPSGPREQVPLDLHEPVLSPPPGEVGPQPTAAGHRFQPSEIPDPNALEVAADLAPDSLPFSQDFVPARAAGMSQEVPGTTLYPELRAVRGRPDEVTGELSLADDIVGPQTPLGGLPEPTPSGQPPTGSSGLDLAADMGIEVVPSATLPGSFEVSVNGQRSGVVFGSAEEAHAAALDFADSMLAELPETPRAAPAPQKPWGGQGLAPQNVFDDLFSENIDLPSTLESGERRVTTTNGEVLANDIGNALQIKRADVAKAARGKGEGTAMYRQLFDQAAADGKTVVSDVSVSPEAAKVYARLEREGYTIKKNPATISKETGNWVSNDPNTPVFEIVAAPLQNKATGT